MAPVGQEALRHRAGQQTADADGGPVGRVEAERRRAGQILHDHHHRSQRDDGAGSRPDAGHPRRGGLGRVAGRGTARRSRIAVEALPARAHDDVAGRQGGGEREESGDGIGGEGECVIDEPKTRAGCSGVALMPKGGCRLYPDSTNFFED